VAPLTFGGFWWLSVQTGKISYEYRLAVQHKISTQQKLAVVGCAELEFL
jgi:hypothetical protein